MFGAHYFGQPVFGDGYRGLFTSVLTVLKSLTFPISGFKRYTRRII